MTSRLHVNYLCIFLLNTVDKLAFYINLAWVEVIVCCGVMVEGDASNVCGSIPCSVEFILGLVTISAVVVCPLVALGAPIHGLPDPVLHDLPLPFLRRS